MKTKRLITRILFGSVLSLGSAAWCGPNMLLLDLDRKIYQYDVSADSPILLGTADRDLNDIALNPNGDLYGVGQPADGSNYSTVYKLVKSGSVFTCQPFAQINGDPYCHGIEFKSGNPLGPGAIAYVASKSVYTVNPNGTYSSIGSIHTNVESDFHFIDMGAVAFDAAENLYVSTAPWSDDAVHYLYRVDGSAKATKISTLYDVLFNALCYAGGNMYIVRGNGIYQVNLDSGTVTFLHPISELIAAIGATAGTLGGGGGNLPNLVPYRPNDSLVWSDKMTVSKFTGATADSTGLTSADNLYINWAILNNGAATTPNAPSAALYVDNVLSYTFTFTQTLPPNYYWYWTDYSLGRLSPGSHTLKLVADPGNACSESNESDNTFEKSITIGGQSSFGPDLVCASGNFSISRGKLQGSFNVGNHGNMPADKSTAFVYFVSDLNATTVNLLKIVSVAKLKLESGKTVKVSLKNPSLYWGGGYIVVHVDAPGYISETNEDNNIAVFGPLP